MSVYFNFDMFGELQTDNSDSIIAAKLRTLSPFVSLFVSLDVFHLVSFSSVLGRKSFNQLRNET